MSVATYNSEKIAKKKVVFVNGGSAVTLRAGWAVCYDNDKTDISQAYTVQKPEAANLKYFAGVITEDYEGREVAASDTIHIEIYIPTKYGQVVSVFISQDHSADTALLEITDGSFILTEGTVNKVARTVQLVNRSSVNGRCLARLYGLSDPLV